MSNQHNSAHWHRVTQVGKHLRLGLLQAADFLVDEPCIKEVSTKLSQLVCEVVQVLARHDVPFSLNRQANAMHDQRSKGAALAKTEYGKAAMLALKVLKQVQLPWSDGRLGIACDAPLPVGASGSRSLIFTTVL